MTTCPSTKMFGPCINEKGPSRPRPEVLHSLVKICFAGDFCRTEGGREPLSNVGVSLRSAMSFSAICRQVGLKDLASRLSVYPGATESIAGSSLLFKRWATKKTAGSTKNGRDSKPKNLGIKKFGGERVIPGNIIVRQRGTRFHPGDYVSMGKDHTLFALKEGNVRFEKHKLSGRKWVHVDPKEGHVLHPLYADADAKSSEAQLC